MAAAVGGHSSGTAVVVSTILFCSLAGLLTIARLYTRMKVTNSVGVDDYLIVLGQILAVLLTVCMVKQVSHGMGRHFASLSHWHMEGSLKWFWTSAWIYALALGTVKMSILFQYLRFFTVKKWRIACYVTMALNTGVTIYGVVVTIFLCKPVSAFWSLPSNGTCLNRLAVGYSMAGLNIFTDICTTILPIAPLNALPFPKRQKLILMMLFCLGGLTCILSILRLPAIYIMSKTSDVSWDNPKAAIWSAMEVYAGIICSCIPTLKGLMSRLFPSLSFDQSYYNTRSGVRLDAHEIRSHGVRESTNFSHMRRASLYPPEKSSRPPALELHAHPLPVYHQPKSPISPSCASYCPSQDEDEDFPEP